LPSIFSYTIYSYNGIDYSCLAKTQIKVGEMKNIYFNEKKSLVKTLFLHNLNVNLILKLYNLENAYSFQRIEKFLSYLSFFPAGVLSLGINLYLYLYLDRQIPTDIIITAISLVVIPLLQWLIKKIFFYIIAKNVSSFLNNKSDNENNNLFRVKQFIEKLKSMVIKYYKKF
jgi:hypothetical protein